MQKKYVKMMNFVLVASVGVALATNQHHTNQHHQGQTWQFKYPDRPKSSKNSVIAAFYKDGTCSGPVTVVNTAERACQPLPKNTAHKWWVANEAQRSAWHDDSYSGSGSWSSGGDDSSSDDSSTKGRRLSNNNNNHHHNNNNKNQKKYMDLDFAHFSPEHEEGYFTVLCNKRQEHDYDWHQGWDSTDSSDSSSSADDSSSSSATEDDSSSDSSSSNGGVTYKQAQGYWNARPVGGRIMVCKDSGCKKCREAIWFQPLQCIAQQHYGWDYLCRGNKKHHSCGFAGVQAVCAPVAEWHEKPKKEEEKKDDSSSSSAE